MDKLCVKCGKPVTGKFCSNCGTEVIDNKNENTFETPFEKGKMVFHGVQISVAELLNSFTKNGTLDRFGLMKHLNQLTGADLVECREFVEKLCKQGETLGSATATPTLNDEPSQKVPLTKRTWFVVVMLFVFWPVGLIFLWRSSTIKKLWKIVVTAFFALVIVCGITAQPENATEDEKNVGANESAQVSQSKQINDEGWILKDEEGVRTATVFSDNEVSVFGKKQKLAFTFMSIPTNKEAVRSFKIEGVELYLMDEPPSRSLTKEKRTKGTLRVDNNAPYDLVFFANNKGGLLYAHPGNSILRDIQQGNRLEIKFNAQDFNNTVSWSLKGSSDAIDHVLKGPKLDNIDPHNHPKIPASMLKPMKKEHYPKLYKEWGADWFNKLNKMLPQAVLIAAESNRCDQVAWVDVSGQRSTPRQNAVFFVDCKNGERFYVSQSDIENMRAVASVKESTSKYSDGDYIEACGQAAKKQATHPSTFSFSRVMDASVYRTDNGRVVAQVGCEAKNSFNLTVKMQAKCIFDERGLIDLEIKEKGQ